MDKHKYDRLARRFLPLDSRPPNDVTPTDTYYIIKEREWWFGERSLFKHFRFKLPDGVPDGSLLELSPDTEAFLMEFAKRPGCFLILESPEDGDLFWLKLRRIPGVVCIAEGGKLIRNETKEILFQSIEEMSGTTQEKHKVEAALRLLNFGEVPEETIGQIARQIFLSGPD